MPYRESLDPIQERLPELREILAHPLMIFQTNEPKRLAYRLREALRAASVLGVKPYNELYGKREVLVRAPYVYVRIPHEIKVEVAEVRSVTAPVFDRVGADYLSSKIFDDIRVVNDTSTDFDVIGAVLANKDALELHFPDYEGDVDSIQSWCFENGYVCTEEKPLVVTRLA